MLVSLILMVLPATALLIDQRTRGLISLFSISEGIWTGAPAPPHSMHLKELSQAVDIGFDQYDIPHIFAQNEKDAMFAQGALLAHFRLFEMDLTTRAPLGRLSELLGDKTLKYDRFFVTFGLRQAVAAEDEELNRDPLTASLITSYVNGINAYIDQLTYKNLPIEYKLLGQWPEKWTTKRVASLMKSMTFRLASRSNDLRITAILKKLGEEKTNQLFPEFLGSEFEVPFQEIQIAKSRSDFNWQFAQVTEMDSFPSFLQTLETDGSNSWAIGPEKSKTGHSILANDTHLGLQLPAIFFENQITIPQYNSYGVSFPGAPGIILGFNKDVAWGVTNGTTDVLDWFEIEFRAEDALEYRIGEDFKPLKVYNEKIEVRGSLPEEIPVLFTDFGVVMTRNGRKGLAARWMGQRPTNEMKTLQALVRSKSIEDCNQALESWYAPVQNFTCADEKNISIKHTGKIPIRPSGAGRIVAKPTGGEWMSDIPFEELPFEKNPERGFVLSANERPANPSYPYYLGWDFEEPFRAKRIETWIKDHNKLDGADLIQMQNDTLNQHALQAMPILIKNLESEGLSDREKSLIEALKQWDFLQRSRSIEPTVFAKWWRQTEILLWDELAFLDPRYYPKKARTIWLFQQIDHNENPALREWIQPYSSSQALITDAFHRAVKELEDELGHDPSTWTWNRMQKTQAKHVAKLPGFGSEEFEMDGGAYSINANKGFHGPAWKLVVELGPRLQAWSQFPGGVTGHPFDPKYDQFMKPWSRGEMRSVRFWKDTKQMESEAKYVWRWGK